MTGEYVSLILDSSHPEMIQTYHVYKTYPGGTAALSDVSIRVERGEKFNRFWKRGVI